MDDAYAREWTVPMDDPDRRTRLRFGITKCRGAPVHFVVQLEYRHAGSWLEVARFDHDRHGRAYADVRSEGLHLDVYDLNGNQKRKEQHFDPMPEKPAVAYAERFLKREYQRLITEFEECR